jgi:hypothetical protein
MKIIEALKRIKEHEQKVVDLKERIKENCALTSVETPRYGTMDDQKSKIKEWLQSVRDTLLEIERLRVAIQETNLKTKVEIELPDGNKVSKNIASWIHRRRDLAKSEMESWRLLTDRGMREGQMKMPSGDIVDVKLSRFFNAEERDEKIDSLTREPSVIDSRLEIINAVTDLIE